MGRKIEPLGSNPRAWGLLSWTRPRRDCPGGKGTRLIEIFIDADGCPVKEEIYRVAARHGARVKVVSNSWMRVPDHESVELVVVSEGLDEADDWIVDHVSRNGIVVTADIPLASRSLEKGAKALSPKGRIFSEDTIGTALADRDLLAQLRSSGMMTGGPAPMAKKDRSRFLERLEEVVRSVERELGSGVP